MARKSNNAEEMKEMAAPVGKVKKAKKKGKKVAKKKAMPKGKKKAGFGGAMFGGGPY